MSDRPTFCSECDHVYPETRKKLPVYWLCMKHPRLEGMGFVAPNLWVEMEPYQRCVGINGGKCPCFSLVRNGQLVMDTKPQPKGTDNATQ